MHAGFACDTSALQRQEFMRSDYRRDQARLWNVDRKCPGFLQRVSL